MSERSSGIGTQRVYSRLMASIPALVGASIYPGFFASFVLYTNKINTLFQIKILLLFSQTLLFTMVVPVGLFPPKPWVGF